MKISLVPDRHLSAISKQLEVLPMIVATLTELQAKLDEVLANQAEAEAELTAKMDAVEAFLLGGDIPKALETVELIRAGSRRLADIVQD
jgi:hypothetical protein